MFKQRPTFQDGKLIEVSLVNTTPQQSKAERRAAKNATARQLTPAQTGVLQDGRPVQPAARLMKVGSSVKPAGQQPAYKLRQKLADLDLQLQHPHLNKKWRKKMPAPRAAQVPVERGRRKP